MTGQISTRVRREWRLAKADLAGGGRSAFGGGLLGGAAVLGSVVAVVLGLAVVAIDLAWLPWPVLLLVAVMVAVIAWMAVRLSRRRRAAARPAPGARR